MDMDILVILPIGSVDVGGHVWGRPGQTIHSVDTSAHTDDQLYRPEV